MLSLSSLVFFLPSLVFQPASRLLFLLCFWFCVLLLTHSLLKESSMHAGWVRFSAWRRDLCATAMVLPILEEGLGSSFHHVFSHFSLPLALFSRSTLGDLHVASRFQSSLWEEGEGLLHAAGCPFGEEERSPSLSLCISTPS